MNRIKLKSLFTDYVMAPSRYLDATGADPHATFAGRFFTRTENKIGAGVFLAFTAAGAAVNDPSIMGASVMGFFPSLLATTCLNIGRLSGRSQIFFDTKPERPRPLKDENAIENLNEDYNHFKLFGPLTLIAGFSAAALLVAFKESTPVIPFVVSFLATPLANAFLVSSRAHKVMTGQWNALTDKPDSPMQDRVSHRHAPELVPVRT